MIVIDVAAKNWQEQDINKAHTEDFYLLQVLRIQNYVPNCNGSIKISIKFNQFKITSPLVLTLVQISLQSNYAHYYIKIRKKHNLTTLFFKRYFY